MKTIIYSALYCPCIHESGFITLSTHKTLEGAEKAIETHKALLKEEWVDWGNSCCEKSTNWYKSFEEFEKRFPFGQHEMWRTSETELLD